MIQPSGPREHNIQVVNAGYLSEAEIRQGVIENGRRWGSFGYYIAEEIDRCLADRAGVRAYLDGDTLRVYYRRPEVQP